MHKSVMQCQTFPLLLPQKVGIWADSTRILSDIMPRTATSSGASPQGMIPVAVNFLSRGSMQGRFFTKSWANKQVKHCHSPAVSAALTSDILVQWFASLLPHLLYLTRS